jgi:hypothetical protein
LDVWKKWNIVMGDLGVDGSIKLTFLLKKQGEMLWAGFTWLGIRSRGRLL